MLNPNITIKDVIKLNKMLDTVQSVEKYNRMDEYGAYEVFDFDKSDEGRAKVLKNKINIYDLKNYINDNLNMKVSELVLKIAKDKYKNLIELDDKIIFNYFDYKNTKINESYSCFNEMFEYYIEGLDCRSFLLGADEMSHYRDEKCFACESDERFNNSLIKISDLLNLKEGKLKAIKENDYFKVSYDGEVFAVWSRKHQNDFVDESNEVYNALNYEGCCYCCGDCKEDDDEKKCKYSNPYKSFARILITDELKLPSFSVNLLLEKINKKYTVVD